MAKVFQLIRQPHPNWSFAQAALHFFQTRTTGFLTSSSNTNFPVGEWDLILFPWRGFVGRDLSGDEFKQIKKMVDELIAFRKPRRSDTLFYLEKEMEKKLLYPPYPVSKAPFSVKKMVYEKFKEGYGYYMPRT